MLGKLDPSSVVAAVLRSVVRYCLRKGLRYSELEHELQRILVEEGAREVQATNGTSSVSKISVVTGLNRPQIAKLLAGETASSAPHDLLSRVVGHWSQNSSYQDSFGKPRALKFQGLASEFASLVSSITREVSHYPILFELERVGAVEIANEEVRLVAHEYTPVGDVEHGLQLLSADVEALLATVEVNLTESREHPHLHLRTSYDNIPPEKIDELRLWILRKGAQFQQEMREHIASYDRDSANTAENGSISDTKRAIVTVTSFSNASEVKQPKKIEPRKRGRKKGIKGS
jgi:hypothetical protein